MFQGVLVDLVPHSAEFEQHAVEWVNGPMGEWWGMDGLLTQAAHRRWIERHRDEPDAVRRCFLHYGLRAKDGTPIGSFSLLNITEHDRMAEVGAGIGNPDYWSGGFGSDGMLLIVQYAFDWLDLRRLWLITSGRNIRAQRQVEKCGYRLEGRRRGLEYINGGYSDMVMYGLMRDEWPGYSVMVERLGLRDKARQRGYLME